MSTRRAWRAIVAATCAMLLAACANTASQGTEGAQASTTTAPASAATISGQPARFPPPTGGVTPPDMYYACKVDADCVGKPPCLDAPCRCVQGKCIAPRPAIDPVIDPAPPET